MINQSILYVYYKLPPSDHNLLKDGITLLQQAIQKFDTTLKFEVLQRPEIGSDGNETWMEVYHHPEGITPEMIQQIHQIALSCGLPEQRKNELFIPLR
jgi:hypothetical protein